MVLSLPFGPDLPDRLSHCLSYTSGTRSGTTSVSAKLILPAHFLLLFRGKSLQREVRSQWAPTFPFLHATLRFRVQSPYW